MSRSTASLASSHTHVDRLEQPPRQENNSILDVEKHAQSEEDPKKETPDTANPHEQISKPGPPGPPGPGGPGVNELYKPKTLKFWLILLCNFLAMFLVALDRTIVATAIPTITDEFHSLGDIGWYGSAYMLTTSAAQLVFGRLYKFYSMKWVFLTCVIIFEIGSAICGAAPSSSVFIAGRAIAGLGSAGIFSGAMLIMIPMIPLHKRPLFQSMFGMIFGCASVLGPLVGGAFTRGVTWRQEPTPILNHIKRLDPLGTLFFIPSVVCLLLALQWGGAKYNWSNWRIIVLFVFFGLLGASFTAVQIYMPGTASIPPRIITQRTVFFGTSFTFFLAGSMLCLVYYLPIWFQTVKLVNPLDSGIYTLPLVLSLVASSILNGIATQKIGYYVPSMLLSPSIMAIGEGLLSTLTRGAPQSHWIGFQFLSGFGLGMGMQAASLACQTVLPMSDIPQGIALVFFTQQLGGAIFTSVGQTILSNLLVSQLAGIPGIDPAEVINNGATELTSIVPAQYIDLVINAYDYTLTRIFLCAMGLAFAALLSAAGMEWKSIKKGKPGMGGPGAAGKPAGPGAVAAAPAGPAAGTAIISGETPSGMSPSPAMVSTIDVASTSQKTEEGQQAYDTEISEGEKKTKASQDATGVQKVEDAQETEHGQNEVAETKVEDQTESNGIANK
ncbi:Putative HC-toxin efflux carrier TOXA [Cytospora mali]|uniref:HC-toxin efflux carrier TOXA n=1 Tax=Cytospora mali TaxID=578113 RepID=A0A194UT10_CYTMA|nr:Putative HC-toxin efflux carrier TOXA [Valsa mali var. pyri (nom. inval.)]